MRDIVFVIVCLLALSSADTFGQELRLGRDDCRRMALRHSETLKEAENEVRMSRHDVKIARSAYLPKLDGSATALLMAPDIDMMGMKLQAKGTYLAGLQLMQPIYAGGKITAGKRLAGIGKDVAEQQVRMCRMDVVVDADNAYWTYIAVRDKVKLMESYKNMIDTLYRQTEAAVEYGMAIESDLLRVSSKRSEIIYQMQKATNGAELCRMALCNLIGADLSTQIVPVDSMPECNSPGILEADVASLPEYHLLGKQIEAAEQQVKMTRGDFLPTIGVSLGYNYYGNIKVKGMADLGDGNYMPYTQKFRDGMFMGVISASIPLFHWGEGRNKIRKAKIAVENATIDLQKNSRLLDLQARQAALSLEDGWRMIESARIGLQQATENLRVLQDRYDESLSPLTDLLDAQSQWQQSESNLIEAVTQYQICLTTWLRVSGNLTVNID